MPKDAEAWWQKWRLLLEIRILALEPLVSMGALSTDLLEILRRLSHLRLERVLEQYLQMRQISRPPYHLSPDPYLRPAYHRYHALQELQQRLQSLAQDPHYSSLISPFFKQHVLEDLNLELLEILANQLGSKRTILWSETLDLLIALGAPPAEDISSFILQEHAEMDGRGIAEEVLQRSRSPIALKAALFFLAQVDDLSVSLPALSRLLHTPGQHHLKAQAVQLLNQVPSAASADLLMNILTDSTPDSCADDGLFAEVRLATLATLRTMCYALPALWSQTIGVLQTGINSPAWSAAARLTAVQILAEQGMDNYLELVLTELKTALAQDHYHEITLALETLKTMGNTQAIPVLMEILQQSFRPHTTLERFRQAFYAERQALQEQIQATLKALGQPVQFNAQQQY